MTEKLCFLRDDKTNLAISARHNFPSLFKSKIFSCKKNKNILNNTSGTLYLNKSLIVILIPWLMCIPLASFHQKVSLLSEAGLSKNSEMVGTLNSH